MGVGGGLLVRFEEGGVSVFRVGVFRVFKKFRLYIGVRDFYRVLIG